MERRLGNDQTMKQSPVARKGGKRLLVAALTAFLSMAAASAQNYGERPIRYGNTSGHFFDGRGDHRDFPTDGFFPGNFAADPVYAAIGGAAGFLESNPQRSAAPYPSQTYFGFARDRTDCGSHRFHDALNVRRCGRGP
ncbi:hypothetical protein GALL_449450 [mine drainage metagenome]|uniref:Uncharacterized protein n=1 Tax=mine drainage metagenome TaxID=410659 RepID=A0A1J5PPB5_9ZZZZ